MTSATCFLPFPVGLLKLLRSLKKSEKEARILVLGLGEAWKPCVAHACESNVVLPSDNSGKTTILKKLAEEDATQ